MTTKWVLQIKSQMQDKSNEELLDMWVKNDRQQWSDSAFEAVRLILAERHMTIPEQNQSPKGAPADPVSNSAKTVGAGMPEAYWEVKSADGSLRRYSREDEMVDAIMAVEIKPGDECRHVRTIGPSGKRQEPKWKRVSSSLARSSFRVRVLFEPVWAHTVRGRALGTMLGIMFWLASGVYVFIGRQVNFPAGIVWAFMLIVMADSTIEVVWSIKKGGLRDKIFGAAIIGLIFCGFQVGVRRTLEGVGSGFSGVFGAIVAGSFAGGLPGMILGTVVGLIRKGKLQCAPTATPENGIVMLIRGVILPLIILACGVAACIIFMPKLIEIAAKGLTKQ